MSVVRNTGYNLAAAIVPTLVALVTLPLYIHTMGEERYGVLALVTVLIGYFGAFDFGLSAASAQRIAATPASDIDSRRRIFWTAAGINLGLGLAGGVILGPVAYAFFAWNTTIDPALEAEVLANIVWIALTLPVLMLTAVLRGALQGAGRFAELNLINVIMGPLAQIIPLLVALYYSPSLSWVLPTLYAVRLFGLALQALIVARRVTMGWRPFFDRSRVRDLLSFGGWVTISALIEPLLSTIDRVLIGSALGMRAVSHFTVPAQLAQRSLIVPSALVDAMLPRIAIETEEQAAMLSRRALRAVAAVMTPPMVAGIVWIHPFLEVWISRDFADAAALPARLMLIGCWFNALGFCCFQHLRARGRPKLIAIAHLLEIPPYLAALWFGMAWFGLAGAAAAFALRVLADNLLLARFGNLHGEMARVCLLGIPVLAAAIWLGGNITGIPGLFETASLGAVLLLAVTTAAAGLWLKGEWATLRSAFVRGGDAG